MFILFLSSFSFAEQYYSPESIASNSELFRASQEKLMPIYSRLESELSRWEEGLRKEELAVYLLNDADRIKSYKDEKLRYTENAILFDKRAGQTINSYESLFMSAVEAEISNYPGAKECSEQAGLMSFNDNSESCEGENISALLAQKIDASEKLKTDLAAVDAIPWPTINLAEGPVDSGGEYINILALAQHHFSDQITALEVQRNSALSELLPGLNSEDLSIKEQSIQSATKVHDEFHEGLNVIGSKLNQAVLIINENSSFCTHSPELGGCSGTNTTSSTIESIEGHRKARRILSK